MDIHFIQSPLIHFIESPFIHFIESPFIHFIQSPFIHFPFSESDDNALGACIQCGGEMCGGVVGRANPVFSCHSLWTLGYPALTYPTF